MDLNGVLSYICPNLMRQSTVIIIVRYLLSVSSEIHLDKLSHTKNSLDFSGYGSWIAVFILLAASLQDSASTILARKCKRCNCHKCYKNLITYSIIIKYII